MFEAFYDSQWQFPYGILLLQLPVLAWILLTRNKVRSRWLAVTILTLQVAIVLDNVSKGPWLYGTIFASQFIAIAFVIGGDLRFFVLLERWGHRDTPSMARWIALPIAVSLVIPIAAQVIAQNAIGAADLRVLFLIYESMFTVLALGLLLVTSQRSDLPKARLAWLVKLCAFQLVQYALWASADVVILLGVDLGYLLRVVPNVLYYVAFVPFALKTAPAELEG